MEDELKLVLEKYIGLPNTDAIRNAMELEIKLVVGKHLTTYNPIYDSYYQYVNEMARMGIPINHSEIKLWEER